jgi:hypothetical protein
MRSVSPWGKKNIPPSMPFWWHRRVAFWVDFRGLPLTNQPAKARNDKGVFVTKIGYPMGVIKKS